MSGDTGSARQMSNLQLRIISSVVLIAAVLAVTYLGGVAFRLLSALIAAFMFYEWCTMSRNATAARHQLIAAALLAVAGEENDLLVGEGGEDGRAFSHPGSPRLRTRFRPG